MFVLLLLCAPSGELINAERAKHIALFFDAVGIILCICAISAISVAMHKDGLVDDFIGRTGLVVCLARAERKITLEKLQPLQKLLQLLESAFVP